MPLLVQHLDLCRPWTHLQSPWAAIETHATGEPCMRVSLVVVVEVMNSAKVDPVHSPVVIKVGTIPITAEIPQPEISIAVVDAAVEAYVLAPVAMVKAVTPVIEAPISRSPERAHIRRFHPRPRHPVVTVRSPGPIARCPEVVGIRGRRLLIVWKRRRWLAGLFVRQIALVDIQGLLIRQVTRGLIVGVGITALNGRSLLLIIFCLLLGFVLRVLP